jgi:peptidoglycan/LPS O-acetylase OafA/YrhL
VDKRHLPELDLLRATALVAVAVIHASAWIAPADAAPGSSLAAAVSGLARCCVPAFVFASGFALQRSMAGREIQAGAFLRKRMRRILLPWVACVPLFLWLDWRDGHVGPIGQWLAYGPGHLYFLLLAAQLSVVFVLVPRDARRLRWFAIGAVAVQLALGAWRTYAPLPGGWLAWPGTYLTHEEAPFWLGTFALGCVASQEWPRLARFARLWPVALAVAAAAGGLVLLEAHAVPTGAWREGNGAYLWPSRLPQTIVWSLALLWLGRWFRRVASWAPIRELSQHSLGIYLLHPAVLTVVGPLTSNITPLVRVPMLIAAALAGGWLLVRVLAVRRPTAAAVGEAPTPLRAAAA